MSEAGETDLRARIDALMNSGESQEEEGEPEKEPEQQDQEPAAQADIEEFLKDEEGESQEEEEEKERGQEIVDSEQGLDVSAIAERLGVDPAEVYNIQFKYGDEGESMSLGELKDLGSKVHEIEQRGESLTTQLEDHENDRLRSRAEMNQIISMLPRGTITPEFVETAKEQHRLVMVRERGLLLEAIPAWKDSAQEQIGRDLLVGALSDYGFSKAEVSGMLDHRLVKVIHDFARLRERVRTKGEIVASKIKSGRGSRKPSQTKQTRNTARHARAKELASTDLRRGINELFKD